MPGNDCWVREIDWLKTVVQAEVNSGEVWSFPATCFDEDKPIEFCDGFGRNELEFVF